VLPTTQTWIKTFAWVGLFHLYAWGLIEIKYQPIVRLVACIKALAVMVVHVFLVAVGVSVAGSGVRGAGRQNGGQGTCDECGDDGQRSFVDHGFSPWAFPSCAITSSVLIIRRCVGGQASLIEELSKRPFIEAEQSPQQIKAVATVRAPQLTACSERRVLPRKSVAITRHWSTVLNGTELDLAAFKKEIDAVAKHAQKTASNAE
jgi:hypothetical protein